ncbi:family 16 glycosylhydrolase [Micropruina sp.]|uniref:DUF7402 domain-containing protein n=1 Tax=Micropruina sp. TaxID=2737536 RepID=UPI0039E6C172
MTLIVAPVVLRLNPGRAVPVEVLASSTAAGSDPALLAEVPDGELPGSDRTRREPAWLSKGEVAGAWVEQRFADEREVNRVLIGAAASGSGFSAAVIEFSDGSSLHLTPDESGDVVVGFPARQVTWARLTFTEADGGAKEVSLASWVLDRGGSNNWPASETPIEVRASASSQSTSGPDSLIDGSFATGDYGVEWSAADSDTQPWVELSWEPAREVSSVQIAGPSSTSSDPAHQMSSSLNGVLKFDDGSEVPVFGIADSGELPTTIGFAPRIATSVRLMLRRAFDSADVALREMAVYPRGVTPPVPPSTSAAAFTNEAKVEDCPDSRTIVPPGSVPARTELLLLCPGSGSAIKPGDSVFVAASTGTILDATTMDNSGNSQPLGTATADEDGVAEIILREPLPQGPFGMLIQSRTSPQTRLELQLVGSGEVSSAIAAPERSGRTLLFDDDFDGPLSIERVGAAARYTAAQPAPWGTAEFGDAVFADPTSNPEVLGTGNGVLRIQVSPLGDQPDPNGWNRKHRSGILASVDASGGGLAAQYGYFEARMLAPAGTGTWSAFWMLNAGAASLDRSIMGEVDAVELYGHDTQKACHATHTWYSDATIDDTGDLLCATPEGVSDWSLSWHTYGADIRPGGIDFYVDGALVGSQDSVARQTEPWFFLLNLSLGGGYPVDLQNVGDTANLYVDWVRVYV